MSRYSTFSKCLDAVRFLVIIQSRICCRKPRRRFIIHAESCMTLYAHTKRSRTPILFYYFRVSHLLYTQIRGSWFGLVWFGGLFV